MVFCYEIFVPTMLGIGMFDRFDLY